MPELPEVEARRIAIEKAFKGARLVSFDIYKKGIVKHQAQEVFNGIINNTLTSVERRGKYLIFEFSRDLRFTLHFGLFGEMQIAPVDRMFSSMCARLVYYNDRALFLLKWVSIWFGMGVDELERLGPDPIAEPDKFTLTYFTGALARKKTNMKSFLMDQTNVAGIGAVYADEILFKAGLLPTRRSNSLSKEEISRLYDAIIKTLKTAISKTVAAGREDRQFLSLENKSICPVCGGGIVNTRLAGRRTVYCPACQH